MGKGRLPTYVWIVGLILAGAFCTAVLSPMLHMKFYEPIAAVVLSLFVAVLAVRALGETDLVSTTATTLSHFQRKAKTLDWSFPSLLCERNSTTKSLTPDNAFSHLPSTCVSHARLECFLLTR